MLPEEISVLLVEDNPGDARLVEIMLGEVGPGRFAITPVDSLGAALELLDKRDFGVVLVDFSLPDSSGLETVVKTRDRAAETPIVVLSGRDDEETALKALQSGAEAIWSRGRATARSSRAPSATLSSASRPSAGWPTWNSTTG